MRVRYLGDSIVAISSWVNRGLRIERERLRATTARHASRRLTSREFNRSLLRLVGAESSARDFPRDEHVPEDAFEKEGFSNDAHANPLTKSHLEGLKLAALAAFRDFAPFVEESRSPDPLFLQRRVLLHVAGHAGPHLRLREERGPSYDRRGVPKPP